MKNGAILCPPWRQKITGSKLRRKSKDLRPLRQSIPILIARKGLESYCSARRRVIKPPSIVGTSVTEYFSRRQELLSASLNCIAPKSSLEKCLTNHLSGKAWERPWVTGTLLSSNTINLRRNRKGI